jgi:hypothetical protein
VKGLHKTAQLILKNANVYTAAITSVEQQSVAVLTCIVGLGTTCVVTTPTCHSSKRKTLYQNNLAMPRPAINLKTRFNIVGELQTVQDPLLNNGLLSIDDETPHSIL